MFTNIDQITSHCARFTDKNGRSYQVWITGIRGPGKTKDDGVAICVREYAEGNNGTDNHSDDAYRDIVIARLVDSEDGGYKVE